MAQLIAADFACGGSWVCAQNACWQFACFQKFHQRHHDDCAGVDARRWARRARQDWDRNSACREWQPRQCAWCRLVCRLGRAAEGVLSLRVSFARIRLAGLGSWRATPSRPICRPCLQMSIKSILRYGRWRLFQTANVAPFQ
jgi:hypothetical protein